MSAAAKEYLIVFEAEKCLQCHACETSCSSWRELSPGIHFRRVHNIWNGQYPKIKNISLSLSCLHCVEPACVPVCPVEAITKRKEDGLVLVDQELCIGCGACEQACEFNVPQIVETGEGDKMQKCDFCFSRRDFHAMPPCIDTCPGKALQLKEVSPSEKRQIEQAIKDVLLPPKAL